MAKNVESKLRQIQDRRLVAEFCRRCGKSRAWFYGTPPEAKAEFGKQINAVLAHSPHPVVAAREALGLSQSGLAEALSVSRQTIHAWETQPARQDRVDRVLALRSTLRTA